MSVKSENSVIESNPRCSNRHVPAPQRVPVLRLIGHGGRAYDEGKQARLSVRNSEGGPKGGEGGATSGMGLAI
eukprot:3052411-Pleurochrysis_carterae.AAC.4